MEIGVTGMIMKHVQKHVEDHHKNEQENVITQHQLTVEIHVQDLMKVHEPVEMLRAQVYGFKNIKMIMRYVSSNTIWYNTQFCLQLEKIRCWILSIYWKGCHSF